MKIRLGYASITLTIDDTASKTITYKNYCKLDKKNAGIKLNKIILSNFEALENILNYNIKNDIYFYRMTSELIPLATHKSVDYEVFKRYNNNFKRIGDIIKDNELRVDIHANQYSILNSEKSEVVLNTINILKFYQNMYKAMNIDSKLIMHVGGMGKSKEEGIYRFLTNFKKLPSSLKKIIVLENDDKIYNIDDLIYISNNLNIPIVLDYHHFNCNKGKYKIEDYIEKIFSTWKTTPKIHFSSPKNKKEYRSHNDYISCDEFIDFIEKIKFINRDFDIMIEAKCKDEALFRLIRQLKYKTNYKIEGTTIYL